MEESVFFIHKSKAELEDFELLKERYQKAVNIHVNNNLELFTVLSRVDVQKASKIFLGPGLAHLAEQLSGIDRSFRRLVLITTKGRFKELDEPQKKKLSRNIRLGIQNAKSNGKKIGAPKGNVNRLNKLKNYDPDEVKEIMALIKMGYTYREIVSALSFKISISKITYIKKRLMAS